MPPGPTRQRPNILVVVADDHRHDALHGDRRDGPATPTLDRLAATGTEFLGARVTGGNNQAVCVPSRAALLTGCAPYRALAEPWTPTYAKSLRLAANRVLLGETFKQAGYTTHAVGKWHNDPAALARSFGGGATLFFGGMCPHEDPRLFDWDPTGAYPPEHATRREGFSSQIFADAAIDFLVQQNREEPPFFLYVALTSPHDPRTPPPEYRQRYEDDRITLPANFLPEHPFDNGDLTVRDENLAGRPRTPGEIKQHLADYYAMIEHHDHQVGRIMAALERTGQRSNTIIVYMADHGLAIGSHGLLGKQNLYEHSLRVPLIINGPGAPACRVVGTPVYAHRVFATLCDLCDLEAPSTVDEPSLRPEWEQEGTETTQPRQHFAHYFQWQRAVREGRWKLIQYRVNGRFHEQLFDLEDDPDERNNLAAEKASVTQRKHLAAALDQWWNDLPADPLTATTKPAP